ncbi:hypothetical protein J5N97_001482 [Dioscorea zingiberensis]|uniref:Uncharacterized protein n=1 Tax=Dioscorea zingiberensis TaxID=325984 RepID=A0A9D5BTV7_9LILI|nr:hypothetical protein J5N97_001482 [Dioscorea zingiberensis]
MTSLLSDIGLNIEEAHAFSTNDGYSLDVFVVTGWPYEQSSYAGSMQINLTYVLFVSYNAQAGSCSRLSRNVVQFIGACAMRPPSLCVLSAGFETFHSQAPHPKLTELPSARNVGNRTHLSGLTSPKSFEILQIIIKEIEDRPAEKSGGFLLGSREATEMNASIGDNKSIY